MSERISVDRWEDDGGRVMGAGKDMWMAEIERVEDQFIQGEIDDQEFHTAMRRLGFDPHEIKDRIDAMREDMK